MDGEYDNSVVARCLDDKAKWYWGASIVVGGLVFLLGIVGTFMPEWATGMSYGAVGLTILTFLFNLFFESNRAKAQELRRKLDLHDGFAWPIPSEEINDLLIRCPKSVKRRAKRLQIDDKYFASEEPPGPKRALENLRESAWWSEHLSEKMFKIVFWVMISLLIISIASLVLALSTVESVGSGNLNVYPKIARSVTSLMMLLLSLNVLKLSISYFRFSKAAAKCKEAADSQLKLRPKNIDQTIVKVYEYFIVRSSSPVLPTWLWMWFRDEFNSLYPYKNNSGN